ncbi:MAG: T9SS type A sorting domain-containing protein [Bacteroidales bacterium]
MFSGEYGFYIFPQVIEGEYFVKADLNHTSEYYNQFLSTYYSNKLHWKEADTIFNFSTNWEYDISLVPNTKLMYGPGKVSGNVTFDIDSKDPIDPACYIEIILYDAENHLVDVCHSDKYGNFELNTLDLQMYNVYAEVTGKHTIPLQVELDESLFEITQINITIGDYSVIGSISLGTIDNVFPNTISQVYPNPASDRIYIDLNQQIRNELVYFVIDQQGRSIMSGTIGPDDFNGYLIDINRLNPGLYFLRIEGNTYQTTRRFIKQ